MYDPLGLLFATVNVLLSGFGFLLILIGIRRFATGLLVKALKRAIPVRILLFLYFLTQIWITMSLLPPDTPIEGILGTLFMVGLLYVAYGFVNDWTHADSSIRNELAAST
jgi:hypothetical protein